MSDKAFFIFSIVLSVFVFVLIAVLNILPKPDFVPDGLSP